MIALIYGGAASGKSEVAEALVAQLPAPKAYVATLEPYDAEAYARIQKHVARRENLGMRTVECYGDMAQVALSGAESVMLEDTGNMCGNLLYHFGEEQHMPFEQVVELALAGADYLMDNSAHLVVVANDVFGGEKPQTPEMARYVQCIAQVSARFAERADCLVEVVCGIPLAYRGAQVLAQAGVASTHTTASVLPWEQVLQEMTEEGTTK